MKAQLENRLRDLVCGGKLDMQTAQRDIATDWFRRIKEYFTLMSRSVGIDSWRALPPRGKYQPIMVFDSAY